jgi:hypothetical protein
MARVRWELDHLRSWQRNACFYVDQALVPLYDVLLDRRPFDEERAAAVLRHLRRVPDTLRHAVENLDGHAAEPFARSAVHKLGGAEECLSTAMRALSAHLPTWAQRELPEATGSATQALVRYREWLGSRLDTFDPATSAGADVGFLLHRVALLPYTPQRLREMARQEWNRSVALEKVLRARHRDVPPAVLPATVGEHVRRQEKAEQEVREFTARHGLLSRPEDLRRYRFVPMPDYLAPLAWLGVCDDLTSADRCDEDAVRYIPQPRHDLPYFQFADAVDPRLGICHEGVHAQQLAVSWRHPNPVRRRFYDSTPNEGTAFYHEELMLSAGLFDDSPHSALMVAGFMRLRALRAEVDLGLAAGDLTIQQATDQLDRVLKDRRTAWEEAVFFAGNPGQGLSYQTGKLQITELLADLPTGSDLREFHDRLWREGNVPLVLQRWELLGSRRQLDEADRLAGHSTTTP